MKYLKLLLCLPVSLLLCLDVSAAPSGVVKIWNPAEGGAASGTVKVDGLNSTMIGAIDRQDGFGSNLTLHANSPGGDALTLNGEVNAGGFSITNIGNLVGNGAGLTNLNLNETDPVFTNSPAAGISAQDITDWDTAHGWGDHSLEGYLTSETDDQTASEVPTVTAQFNGNLSGADTTVQLALDTIDDLVIGGGGGGIPQQDGVGTNLTVTSDGVGDSLTVVDVDPAVVIYENNFDAAVTFNPVSHSRRDDATYQWVRSSNGHTTWTVVGGALEINVTNYTGGGAGAILIPVSSIKGLRNHNAIRLTLDYTITGTDSGGADGIYIHVWGYKEDNVDAGMTYSLGTTSMGNLGATGGSMWESSDASLTPGATGIFDDYNFKSVAGDFTGNSGVSGDAAVIVLLSGGSSGSVDTTLPMGAGHPLTKLSQLDYIHIGIAQRDANIDGLVTIDNLSITAVNSDREDTLVLDSFGTDNDLHVEGNLYANSFTPETVVVNANGTHVISLDRYPVARVVQTGNITFDWEMSNTNKVYENLIVFESDGVSAINFGGVEWAEGSDPVPPSGTSLFQLKSYLGKVFGVYVGAIP